MEPWLNRSDLLEYIGDIPPSFTLDKLRPALMDVLEGWLTDVLEPTHVTTYRGLFGDYSEHFGMPYPTVAYSYLTLAQYEAGKVLKKFLAYAVWSIYIKKSNFITTETGVVVKINPDSDPISDRQRTELSNHYEGLAERKALELQRLLITPLSCNPAYGGSGRPTIRKAQRLSPSRMGN